ncbi:Mucin-associated surface protein (MASP) [Trypanosoma cruzi]|uniref:Mucin-associated surface protein (MASP), putative n=2 Tax=Trypanosoma cruzi TaxID=5693 RepID=Q4E3D4_TRYCC|nr:mucin-associated surface protein (MASP), putative [Trypanosoma cruzi]EAN99300.1 mucin-associated surface protein (MASP), putative [Trypanosoma cruzi]PWV20764.1 Mucin-associated surface protein (MASP) [Trypanosoma cruzi]|eukprot:XP_821151.1 mucin-associated surface protein (MASP) [Trypanosoma cruzi strain CL Brener]
MAMTMTGRVLLLCALCVLWCGAGGRCDVEVVRVADSPANSESGSVAPDKDTDHTVHGGAGVVSGEQSQKQKVGGHPLVAPQLQAVLQPESTVQQTLFDTEPTDSLSHSQSLQEERQGGSPDGSSGRPAASHSQEDRKNESIGDQQRKDPPSPAINNDVVSRKSEELTEDTPRRTEIIDAAHSEERQEPENVTPSLEQTRETSTAAPAITTQTISMQPPEENASSTVKMSDASPQPTGTANTNHTTTPGDSDGSTAVSHTTSPPLLLLVFVACAAAAVVAA